MANSQGKGRGGNRNFPNAAGQRDLSDGLYSKHLRDTLNAYKQTRVRSDEELEQRLSDYFTYCAANDIIPTVEEMCLYTGYSAFTVHDWETGRRKGFSPETAQIIKKAKSFLAVFDAKMVITGKLNPVAYIFRAKNYYGMKDQQDITVSPADPLGDTLTREEIAKRLMQEASSGALPDRSATVIDLPEESATIEKKV